MKQPTGLGPAEKNQEEFSRRHQLATAGNIARAVSQQEGEDTHTCSEANSIHRPETPPAIPFHMTHGRLWKLANQTEQESSTKNQGMARSIIFKQKYFHVPTSIWGGRNVEGRDQKLELGMCK